MCACSAVTILDRSLPLWQCEFCEQSGQALWRSDHFGAVRILNTGDRGCGTPYTGVVHLKTPGVWYILNTGVVHLKHQLTREITSRSARGGHLEVGSRWSP